MAEVLCCVTLGVVNFYVGLKKIRKKDTLGTTVIKRHSFLLGDDREDVSLHSCPANQLLSEAFATSTNQNIETTTT